MEGTFPNSDNGMAEVYTWKTTTDAQQLIKQAVQALAEGRLVVFPTDTGYVLGADARHAGAIEQLGQESPPGNVPWMLAVRSVAQALELVPDLPPLAHRLARRCWPGPLTLLVSDNGAGPGPSLTPLAGLSAARVEDCLSLASPAHAALLHTLHQLGAPLVIAPLGSELPAGPHPATALTIEDDPCPCPEGPTVVRIAADQWRIVRSGACSPEQIEAQLATLVVFVCTGNTCRSPLAEVLCKKLLAERLGCQPDDLPRQGFVVLSAGLAAFAEGPAAAPAVEVARSYSMDLGGHLSRPLNYHLAFQADHLICMTQGHLQALTDSFASLGCTPRLLSPDGEDLPDPIGQEEAVYRTCAERIWRDLESVVQQLLSD